jgi:hypothetical protein
MTTRVTIKNEGPDELLIRFYDHDRQFINERVRLPVGESTEVMVWNGKLPVLWPIGHTAVDAADGSGWFYAVPPATY